MFLKASESPSVRGTQMEDRQHGEAKPTCPRIAGVSGRTQTFIITHLHVPPSLMPGSRKMVRKEAPQITKMITAQNPPAVRNLEILAKFMAKIMAVKSCSNPVSQD